MFKIGDRVKIKNVKNSPIGVIVEKCPAGVYSDWVVNFYDENTRIKQWQQDLDEDRLEYYLAETDTRNVIFSDDKIVADLAVIFGDIVVSSKNEINTKEMKWGETQVLNQSFTLLDLVPLSEKVLYLSNCNIVIPNNKIQKAFKHFFSIKFNNCYIITQETQSRIPIENSN